MTLEHFWPILAGFLATVLLMPVLIPLLHKLKFGQQVRKEGIQAHLKKQGTPTMGGIGFLLAAILVSVVFGFILKADWALLLPILLMSVSFALIGRISAITSRSFSRSVVPVSTISTITSERPTIGASSIEPFSLMISTD